MKDAIRQYDSILRILQVVVVLENNGRKAIPDNGSGDVENRENWLKRTSRTSSRAGPRLGNRG